MWRIGTLHQLKVAAFQLEKQAQSCEEEQRSEEAKIRKALQQKDLDVARIYAENAIRKKNEALNYLRLASRMNGVASTMLKINYNCTNEIELAAKDLENALASMDLEKVSAILKMFEKHSNLDVHSSAIDQTMDDVTSQVDALIDQIAEESGLSYV